MSTDPRLILVLVNEAGALEPHPLGAALVARDWYPQFAELAARVEREHQRLLRRVALADVWQGTLQVVDAGDVEL
jgi:hypothetical protein